MACSVSGASGTPSGPSGQPDPPPASRRPQPGADNGLWVVLRGGGLVRKAYLGT